MLKDREISASKFTPRQTRAILNFMDLVTKLSADYDIIYGTFNGRMERALGTTLMTLLGNDDEVHDALWHQTSSSAICLQEMTPEKLGDQNSLFNRILYYKGTNVAYRSLVLSYKDAKIKKHFIEEDKEVVSNLGFEFRPDERKVEVLHFY